MPHVTKKEFDNRDQEVETNFAFGHVSMGTDKQLVELIHVKALEVLRSSEPSALRYQSITLFLRGGLIIRRMFHCNAAKKILPKDPSDKNINTNM